MFKMVVGYRKYDALIGVSFRPDTSFSGLSGLFWGSVSACDCKHVIIYRNLFIYQSDRVTVQRGGSKFQFAKLEAKPHVHKLLL